jgi:hypothetical protein
MGGLGNQLFQIITTIAYGMKHSRKIIFPYAEMTDVGLSRNTYWDTFLSSIKFLTTINNKNGITNDVLLKFPQYDEPYFPYAEIPIFDNNELLLFGYYQSYKYFDNEKDTIFSLIRLREQQKMIINEYSLFNNDIHKVSMHFRLGDYKNLQDMFPLMPYEYYEKSIDKIMENRSDMKMNVYFFCEKEDNDIVYNMIDKLNKKYPSIEFVKIDDTIPDWKQMLIMSCCDDNIIANSSFSWWGAYFNDKPNKIVCYPSKWFGHNMNNDTRDLCPSSWKKIEI